MTTAPFFHRTNARGKPVPSRLGWGVLVLALSALLHLIAINRIADSPSLAAPPVAPPVIVATLHEAPPAPPPARTKPPPRPKKKTAAPRRRAPRPPPVAPVEAPAASPTPTGAAPGEPVDTQDQAPAAAQETGNNDVGAPATENEPVAAYKVSLPPSAELLYDVQKTVRDGQPMYGHGSIKWHTDGSRYTVDGEAGVLFVTVLSFRSEGEIDGQGVAPEIYSEKRFRKSETATHFHRERNTISFSASTKSYPRHGGEQDRASVVWQLAGIGRGDRQQFVAGAHIDLFVAGTRDADTWRMVVLGEENIRVGDEQVTAWHVSRVPRPGTYDQQLDIWLAPSKEWYPVRLRYTETNGDYLDMSLANLNVLSAL